MRTLAAQSHIQGRIWNFILPAVLIFGLPAVSHANPCLPGSLQSYINLGVGGCEIDSTNLNNFSLQLLDPLATLIPAGAISVTPILGGDLRFGVNQNAVSPQFFDALIGYSVTGAHAPGALLTMSGASATGTGVVTAVEDICVGGMFLGDPSICFGGTHYTLINLQDGFGNSILTDEVKFGSFASFFDVFTEIAIDAGPAGTASLNGSVTNQVVPEPSTVLLLGTGLACLLFRRRLTR